MIFIHSITADVVKRGIIKTYNAQNGFKLGINPPLLNTMDSNEPMKGYVVDVMTKRAIAFGKVDLGKLIDPNIDISGFKDIDTTTHQLSELTPDEVASYNQQLGINLLSVYENNFSTLSDHEMDTLKKYAVFCRVAGFFELDIGEVTLQSEEGKLIIAVHNNHPLFYGYVEVKTW